MLIQQTFGITADRSTDIALHNVARRAMIDLTKQARNSKDPLVGKQLLGVAAFCTLFHPSSAAEFRSGISDGLRRNGKAHVTISCDARLVFGFAVGQRFTDMEAIIAELPADVPGSISIAKPRPKDEFH